MISAFRNYGLEVTLMISFRNVGSMGSLSFDKRKHLIINMLVELIFIAGVLLLLISVVLAVD